MKITTLCAKEVTDSRGTPTLECTVVFHDDSRVTASVPSGLSVSRYAVPELRDENRSVASCIELIKEKIAPHFVGTTPTVRATYEFLRVLDKNVFGANTLLAVSLVLFKAASHVQGLEPYQLVANTLCSKPAVPKVLFNLINGGKHAIQGSTSFQEVFAIPQQPRFSDAFAAAQKISSAFEKRVRQQGVEFMPGDEGGLSLQLSSSGIEGEKEALQLLPDAICGAGFKVGSDVVLGLDVAASTFYDATQQSYVVGAERLGTQQMIDMYVELTQEFQILLIEDPLDQDDRAGWKQLTEKIGQRVAIIGDDIFATNLQRIRVGIEERVATGTIIKPNQVGLLGDVFDVFRECSKHDFSTLVSHRSGETMDTFISDLAVGSGATFLKAGGLGQDVRLSKYKRLLAIASELAHCK